MRQTPVTLALLVLLTACAAPQNVYAPVKHMHCTSCERAAMDQQLPEPLPRRGVYIWSLEAPAAGQDNDLDILSMDFDRHLLLAHRAHAVKGTTTSWQTVAHKEVRLTGNEEQALTDLANQLWAPPAENGTCAAASGDVKGEIYLLDGPDIARMNAIPANCQLRAVIGKLDARADSILRRPG